MPGSELRVSFHRDLELIEAQAVELFTLVRQGISGATESLLTGDRGAALVLMARDELIDRTYRDMEELVQRQLSLQQPMASDLRLLVSVLRIVPELERSGDLAEHIALRAARGLAEELSPRTRDLIAEMGGHCDEMWRVAADAFRERDAEAVAFLRAWDAELDELHVSFSSEIASGVMRIPVAIEMGLVGRFYERLGDHAVNVGNRVRYLATGEGLLARRG